MKTEQEIRYELEQERIWFNRKSKSMTPYRLGESETKIRTLRWVLGEEP